MQMSNTDKTTREGPACGESLGVLDSQRIGPSVYGGANICTEGGDRSVRSLASTSAPALEPRVLLERIDRDWRRDDLSVVPMVVEGTESEAASDDSLVAVAPSANGKFWEGRKRRQNEDSDVSESGGESNPESRPRSRGRPPTTGEYVGLHRAKLQLNAQKREELRLQAEEELQATVVTYRKARKAPVIELAELSKKTAAELHGQIEQEVALIGTIANKSRNLKSDLVRDIRNAVATITGATAEIMTRTTDAETTRLQRQNASLQAELTSIRSELESLRAEMAVMRAQRVVPAPAVEAAECSTPSTSAPKRRRIEPEAAPSLEEVCRRVTVTVGEMVNARLASLEGRLLPEKTLRPPLAAGPKPSATVPQEAPKVPGEKPKGKKGKKKSGRVFVPAPPPPPQTEEWTEVVRKGLRKAPQPKQQQPQARQQQPQARQQQPQARQQQPRQQQPQTRQQPQTWQQQGAKRRKKGERKLRAPRSAAVVVTLLPEAEAKGCTYSQVLDEAKQKITLAEFGIKGLRIRKTATGARLMEVAGANNAERADSLAGKLREVLGSEAVRVHRPVRTAEMRVSGLDDSATVEEVSAAIARVGGCQVDQVQTGAITVGIDGLGSAWLRCPVAAARKVVDGGRLLVGWVSAQVKLLEARAQRCYRCLKKGHMRVACKEEVDRSDECYRCGATGHKARGCTAPAHCKTCSAAGQPADHRSGGKQCTPAARKSTKSSAGGPRAGEQNSRPSTSRAEVVEKMTVG